MVLADVDTRLIDNSGNRSAVWKFYSYQPVIGERPRRDRTLKAWIQFELGRCLVLRFPATFTRHGITSAFKCERSVHCWFQKTLLRYHSRAHEFNT